MDDLIFRGTQRCAESFFECCHLSTYRAVSAGILRHFIKWTVGDKIERTTALKIMPPVPQVLAQVITVVVEPEVIGGALERRLRMKNNTSIGLAYL